MTSEPNLDFFEERRRGAVERLERYGYTAMVIGTGECSVPGCECRPEPYPYAYSLGFCDLDHPEVVAFGDLRSTVNTLMDPVFAAVRAGRPMAVGPEHRHQTPGGPVIALVPVPDLWVRRDPNRIGAWFDIFDPPFPSFVQICWADRHGHLPWETGCDPAVTAAQPILADDPIRYPRPPRNRARHQRSRHRR